jgi:hypothetical protein
MIPANS